MIHLWNINLGLQPTVEAFGAKLTVCADPDGLPFSVAASLKKEPADRSFLGSER
jgi:hypothetical protein